MRCPETPKETSLKRHVFDLSKTKSRDQRSATPKINVSELYSGEKVFRCIDWWRWAYIIYWSLGNENNNTIYYFQFVSLHDVLVN